MEQVKAVAVVGFKAAGKTRVVEALVAELKRRGLRVATVKHTADDQPLDKPGTDTFRHAEAGADSSAIIGPGRTAVFHSRALPIRATVEALGPADIIVFEGFKTLDTLPRIIVPRSSEEVHQLTLGLEIAAVDIDAGLTAGNIPTLHLADAAQLADIAERKGFLLAGMNCRGCGYETCRLLGEAILRGEAESSRCVWYSSGTRLRVNGVEVPLNPFAQKVTRGVILGLVSSFREAEDPQRVEVEIDARGD